MVLFTAEHFRTSQKTFAKMENEINGLLEVFLCTKEIKHMGELTVIGEKTSSGMLVFVGQRRRVHLKCHARDMSPPALFL